MKKRLLLTMAAAFAAEDAPAQTFRYLAFGDSNTCGHQDGSTCAHPPVTVPPLDPNGYPGRLRAALDCQSGTDCQVYNYGKSGEKSGPAISRLTNVLNSQQYDVMLLMHGTNDLIFDESYNALLNNLRTMDDRAAAKDVDTLFAPVIRVHPEGPFSGSASRVADLKDDLLTTIAPERDSWTANPWAVLCPGNNCFNSHYAWPGDNGLHPDPSGYDLMAAEFLGAVQQHPAPTAPTQQAPIGATASTTASWTATANTTWYHLDWSGGEEWLQSAAVCAGGNCNWTIPGLGAGSHTWKVRGRNPRGRGTWSATQNFELFTVSPPATTALDPVGSFFGAPPAQFVWSDADLPVNGVTAYQLQVERDGITVFDQDVPVSGCDGVECTHSPGIAWANGNYLWRVRSRNPAGNSAWSSWIGFLFMADSPSAPTALEPSIDTFDTTPLFTWTREFGVEEYQVQIDSETPKTADADTACGASTCSWAPGSPRAVGNHSWRVKAINSVGESPYSATRGFEILPCTAPTDRDLTDATVSVPTTEAACHSLNAHTNYVVAAPNGDLELHAGNTITLNPGFRVESGARLRCRVDP